MKQRRRTREAPPNRTDPRVPIKGARRRFDPSPSAWTCPKVQCEPSARNSTRSFDTARSSLALDEDDAAASEAPGSPAKGDGRRSKELRSLRWVLGYLKRYRLALALTILSMLALVAIQLIGPWLVKTDDRRRDGPGGRPGDPRPDRTAGPADARDLRHPGRDAVRPELRGPRGRLARRGRRSKRDLSASAAAIAPLLRGQADRAAHVADGERHRVCSSSWSPTPYRMSWSTCSCSSGSPRC